MNGWNVVAEKVEWFRLFCLSRDPSPFDFAQGQDDGKNKDGKTEADSSAALRNDKQKDEQRQMQMQGFFPFDKLRVGMTTLEQALGVEEELSVAHDLFFSVGVA